MVISNKIKGYVSILRPQLAIMTLTLAGVVVLLASYLTFNDFPDIFRFIFVVLATYFAVVGSYVFNDYCDVDIDKINFPNRAIPSSSLRPFDALIYSIFLYCLSLIIFLFLSIYSFIVVIISIFIISLYSKIFKRTTNFSFIPVGISYGLVPLGVWLSISEEITIVPILFCLMICITDWGFTNSDASRDVVADKKKGAITFPVRFGIYNTTILIFICWMIGIGLSLWIGLVASLSQIYMLVSIAAGIWILLMCYNFSKNPKPEFGGNLFFQASKYRAIIFFTMMADIILILLNFKLDFL